VGLMKIENLIRYTPHAVGLMEIEHLFRYPALAVGLMGIENLFRYPALAVGLKPSASQGEARLRGLYQIIYSKTISPRLSMAKPACASRERQRRPSRLSPLHSEARLRGLYQIIYSKTISPRLSMAKPACASRELQRRTYRPSAIAYRLSVIGYRLREALGYLRRSPPARARSEGGTPLRALQGQVFWGSPCVPSPVSSHQNARLPFSRKGRRGLGLMRGKGARECRKRDAHRSSAPGTSQNDQD